MKTHEIAGLLTTSVHDLFIIDSRPSRQPYVHLRRFQKTWATSSPEKIAQEKTVKFLSMDIKEGNPRKGNETDVLAHLLSPIYATLSKAPGLSFGRLMKLE